LEINARKMNFHNVLSTPFGPIHTSVNQDGALVSLRFASFEGECTPDRTSHADQEILQYIAGERQQFTIPLAPEGSEFQHRIWRILTEIPFGTVRTYGDLAKQIGNPNAARAVGRANATNPIALVVPCHRVIGTSGTLTGFAYGVEIKRQLLEFEGVTLSLNL
jgi:methylated-DNA-[protein]-cysteine S-methyltransferase